MPVCCDRREVHDAMRDQPADQAVEEIVIVTEEKSQEKNPMGLRQVGGKRACRHTWNEFISSDTVRQSPSF